MKLVYLACPYSHRREDIRRERFEKVNRYAAKLMDAGILVFSPISHTHPIALAGNLPKGWDFWEQYDRAFLVICRAMVVLCLDGWQESRGVMAEIKIMDDLRRPIWYLREGNADCLAVTIRALEGGYCKEEDRAVPHCCHGQPIGDPCEGCCEDLARSMAETSDRFARQNARDQRDTAAHMLKQGKAQADRSD